MKLPAWLSTFLSWLGFPKAEKPKPSTGPANPPDATPADPPAGPVVFVNPQAPDEDIWNKCQVKTYVPLAGTETPDYWGKTYAGRAISVKWAAYLTPGGRAEEPRLHCLIDGAPATLYQWDGGEMGTAPVRACFAAYSSGLDPRELPNPCLFELRRDGQRIAAFWQRNPTQGVVPLTAKDGGGSSSHGSGWFALPPEVRIPQ
jgi:hypothetical protein